MSFLCDALLSASRTASFLVPHLPTRLAPGADWPSTIGARMRLDRTKASLAVQVLQSATALLIAFILMPVLGTTGFGAFALAVAIQLFVLGAIDSAVLTPMTVAASRYGSGIGAVYVFRRVRGIVILATGLSAIAGLLVLAAGPLHGPTRTPDVMLAAAIALGALAICAREVFRVGLLFSRCFRLLVVAEAISAVATIGLVAGLRVSVPGPVGVSEALLVVAMATFVQVLVCLPWLAGRKVRNAGVMHSLLLVRRGLTSLAAAKVTWLQSQSYIFLVGLLASAAVLGKLAAARLLFAPLQTIFAGVSRGLLPELASSYAAGHGAAFRNVLRRGYWSYSWLVLLWTAVGLFAFPVLFPLIGAGDFSSDPIVYVSWGVVFCVTGLRSIGSVGLRATGRFGLLLRQGLIGAVISLIAVPVLVIGYGGVGALWGLALSEAVAFAYALSSIQRLLRNVHG